MPWFTLRKLPTMKVRKTAAAYASPPMESFMIRDNLLQS
jgi:hypothetical protein